MMIGNKKILYSHTYGWKKNTETYTCLDPDDHNHDPVPGRSHVLCSAPALDSLLALDSFHALDFFRADSFLDSLLDSFLDSLLPLALAALRCLRGLYRVRGLCLANGPDGGHGRVSCMVDIYTSRGWT